MRRWAIAAAVLLISGTAKVVSAQLCSDENPSLVNPPRDSYQVCTPRPRGGFGFWSRVTSLAAADAYVMPKYAPRGYTYTVRIGLTNDFNSGPRLRHYVNYLPPLPYTHPPIYPPVPGGESSAAAIRDLATPASSSVQIEY
ncbi:MAG: hypothetical protein N2Z21_04695 [Candidatus Sumerlaeaceae bacterium]|nr:hypothetical protein [Candidatus Sumerlaeaceae bacterium]